MLDAPKRVFLLIISQQTRPRQMATSRTARSPKRGCCRLSRHWFAQWTRLLSQSQLKCKATFPRGSMETSCATAPGSLNSETPSEFGKCRCSLQSQSFLKVHTWIFHQLQPLVRRNGPAAQVSHQRRPGDVHESLPEKRHLSEEQRAGSHRDVRVRHRRLARPLQELLPALPVAL